MRLFVILQLGFLIKAPGAEAAGVCLQFVIRALVVGQVNSLAKLLVTAIAVVWFQARVGAFVYSKMSPLYKSFTAVTHKWFEPCMDPFMAGEMCLLAERFLANIASVGLDP